MAKQSEETKLRRRKPANRRGVFTTWGNQRWQALLTKSSGDVTDSLSKCSAVGAIERDVTAAVMDGTWSPPAGEWMLVVWMDTQDWVTVVPNLWPSDVIEKLAKEYDGQWLTTGYSKFMGMIYVRVVEKDPSRADGIAVRLEFQSDGTPWDDEDEDEDVDNEEDDVDESRSAIDRLTETRFIGDGFEPNYLEQFASLPDAHQAIIRHLDAYVSGLFFDTDELRLWAPFGHDDILQHVTRVDLVRLGTITPDEPSPKSIKATKTLHDAIDKGNVEAVRAAIAKGALLTPTNGGSSALYSACFNLAYAPYEPRIAVIETLLDAKADPNENRCGPAEHYADTPLFRLIQSSRPPFEVAEPIARRLAEAGADLNAPSPFPLDLGERPLHRAAKKALPRWVELLLNLGADPMAKCDKGRTARESVEDLIAAKAASDFYTADDIEQERKDYAPVLERLARAESE